MANLEEYIFASVFALLGWYASVQFAKFYPHHVRYAHYILYLHSLLCALCVYQVIMCYFGLADMDETQLRDRNQYLPSLLHFAIPAHFQLFATNFILFQWLKIYMSVGVTERWLAYSKRFTTVICVLSLLALTVSVFMCVLMTPSSSPWLVFVYSGIMYAVGAYCVTMGVAFMTTATCLMRRVLKTANLSGIMTEKSVCRRLLGSGLNLSACYFVQGTAVFLCVSSSAVSSRYTRWINLSFRITTILVVGNTLWLYARIVEQRVRTHWRKWAKASRLWDLNTGGSSKRRKRRHASELQQRHVRVGTQEIAFDAADVDLMRALSGRNHIASHAADKSMASLTNLSGIGITSGTAAAGAEPSMTATGALHRKATIKYPRDRPAVFSMTRTDFGLRNHTHHWSSFLPKHDMLDGEGDSEGDGGGERAEEEADEEILGFEEMDQLFDEFIQKSEDDDIADERYEMEQFAVFEQRQRAENISEHDVAQDLEEVEDPVAKVPNFGAECDENKNETELETDGEELSFLEDIETQPLKVFESNDASPSRSATGGARFEFPHTQSSISGSKPQYQSDAGAAAGTAGMFPICEEMHMTPTLSVQPLDVELEIIESPSQLDPELNSKQIHRFRSKSVQQAQPQQRNVHHLISMLNLSDNAALTDIRDTLTGSENSKKRQKKRQKRAQLSPNHITEQQSVDHTLTFSYRNAFHSQSDTENLLGDDDDDEDEDDCRSESSLDSENKDVMSPKMGARNSDNKVMSAAMSRRLRSLNKPQMTQMKKHKTAEIMNSSPQPQNYYLSPITIDTDRYLELDYRRTAEYKHIQNNAELIDGGTSNARFWRYLRKKHSKKKSGKNLRTFTFSFEKARYEPLLSRAARSITPCVSPRFSSRKHQTALPEVEALPDLPPPCSLGNATKLELVRSLSDLKQKSLFVEKMLGTANDDSSKNKLALSVSLSPQDTSPFTFSSKPAKSPTFLRPNSAAIAKTPQPQSNTHKKLQPYLSSFSRPLTPLFNKKKAAAGNDRDTSSIEKECRKLDRLRLQSEHQTPTLDVSGVSAKLNYWKVNELKRDPRIKAWQRKHKQHVHRYEMQKHHVQSEPAYPPNPARPHGRSWMTMFGFGSQEVTESVGNREETSKKGKTKSPCSTESEDGESSSATGGEYSHSEEHRQDIDGSKIRRRYSRQSRHRANKNALKHRQRHAQVHGTDDSGDSDNALSARTGGPRATVRRNIHAWSAKDVATHLVSTHAELRCYAQKIVDSGIDGVRFVCLQKASDVRAVFGIERKAHIQLVLSVVRGLLREYTGYGTNVLLAKQKLHQFDAEHGILDVLVINTAHPQNIRHGLAMAQSIAESANQ